MSDRERGIGLRAGINFPVLLCEGPHAAHCRAVELSASGVVVDRGRELSERELRTSMKLELFLPGSTRPVRALCKPIRHVGGTRYAFKFVLISDVDRLTLMEHVDGEARESLRLLEELASVAPVRSSLPGAPSVRNPPRSLPPVRAQRRAS
jgi:hypothetical protein